MPLVDLECAGAMLSVSSYLQVASAELSAGLQKLSGLEKRERVCTALEGRLAELQRELEGRLAGVVVAESDVATREAQLSIRMRQVEQQLAEVASSAESVARQQASVQYQCLCSSQNICYFTPKINDLSF